MSRRRQPSVSGPPEPSRDVGTGAAGLPSGGRVREMADLTARGLPEIPLFGFYRFRAAEDQLTPHTHAAFEICFLRAGRQQYCLGGRTHELKSGDFFVTFPGETHGTGGEPQQRGSLFWLHLLPPPPGGRSWLGLAGAPARRLLAALRALPRRSFAGAPAAGEALERLWNLKDALPEPLAVMEMHAELVRLVLGLVRSAAQPSAPAASARMAAVLRVMEEHVAEPPDLAMWAARAGLSVSWFKTMFRRELGMPPVEYVLRRKVAAACEWLAAGRLTVTDIAFRLGFSSSQYFATVFRRYQGVPPSVWRRRSS